MKFLFPSFLWALLAIAIPIIIHILNFRRYKKVYFTNVQLLKEIKLEKNKADNIKRWLILLSRVFAIIFLVLAFAQPYISKNTNDIAGIKRVSIYIDNSYSMLQMETNLPLLEQAKERASEVVSSYSISDEFILITNDLGFNQLRWMNKDEMLEEIFLVKTSPSNLLLSEIYDIQNQQFSETKDFVFEAYVFSDFQTQFANKVEKKGDYNTFLIPLKSAEARNLFIDSSWLLSAIQAPQSYVNLAVKVENSGSTNVENRRLTLKINDEVKAISDITLEANTSIIDTFNVFVREAGIHKVQISITDFPITHDDDFFLNFEVKNQIKILEIFDKTSSKNFSALFKEDNYILLEQQNVNQINYSALETYGLIILNEITDFSSGFQQAIKNYIEKGGALYVVPSPQISQGLNSLLLSFNLSPFGAISESRQEVSVINLEDPVFKNIFKSVQKDIDLPSVIKYYPFQNNQKRGVSLLTMRNGEPLVTKAILEKSFIYIQTVPLNKEFSNLSSHAIFPAMVYNFVLNSQISKPLYYTINPNTAIKASSFSIEKDKVIKMVLDDFEFIPEQRVIGGQQVLFPGKSVKNSGHATLIYDDEVTETVSFNFDRNESVFKFLEEKEITNKYNTSNTSTIITSKINDMGEVSKGIRLWKICIILCLLFLAFEIVFIRYFANRQVAS